MEIVKASTLMILLLLLNVLLVVGGAFSQPAPGNATSLRPEWSMETSTVPSTAEPQAWVPQLDATSLEWARQYGSRALDYALGVAIDADGNVYVTGNSGGELESNNNSGVIGVFLSKYDGKGNLLWTRQYGSSDGDGASGVAIDAASNVYVIGYTSNKLAYKINAGDRDVLLIKYLP